ncbi:hypothetical protein HA402_015950 [Bradysia odoriphaga]|nr:hypothetical protein HA402_015950 [Bradysia odoriphaga]
MLMKHTLFMVFMTLVVFAYGNGPKKQALKWGVAAAGKICSDFVNALSTLSSADHQVVAVATRTNFTRAKEFAQKFCIPTAYAGYENLALNSDIDIVYIGNLNPQHYSTAKLMLDHGKSVLMEKPLTMNWKQSKELTILAQQKGVFFAEGLWSRYLPIYKFIRQEIRGGKLGEIVTVDIELGSVRPQPRLQIKELGGGAILDFGSYGIDILQWVFEDDPIDIEATGKLNDDGVDTDVTAVFSYCNDRKATLKLSINEDLKNALKIVGTKRSMEIPSFWYGTSLIDVNGKLHNWPLPTGAKYPFNNTNRAGLAYEAEAIRKYICAGKKQSDLAGHTVSLSIARIQDELRRQVGVVYINDCDVNYISPNLNICNK